MILLRCQLIELMKYEIRMEMECFVHIEICVGSGFRVHHHIIRSVSSNCELRRNRRDLSGFCRVGSE
jgi:hypothetical protein